MKTSTLYITATGELNWKDKNLKPPSPNQVMAESIMSTLGNAGHLSIFNGRTNADFPIPFQCEHLAKIVSCGEEVKELSPGDRVTFTKGLSGRQLVRTMDIIKVPDNIPDEIALLTNAACRIIPGIRQVNTRPDKPILIMGAGAAGLLTLYILQASNRKIVDVVEPIENRRNLAKSLGARWAIAPEELKDTGGLYPVGFECSRNDEAFKSLQEKMLPSGNISIIHGAKTEPLTLTEHFHQKGLRIIGNSNTGDYQYFSKWFFDSYTAETDKLKEMFEETVKMSSAVKTFEKIASGKARPINVIVKF